MSTKRRDACPRCGLTSVSDSEYHQALQTYIDGIDPDIRTTDEDYQIRLTACNSCKQLVNGLCRLCGCFVEMRAAKKGNCCPGIPSKWK